MRRHALLGSIAVAAAVLVPISASAAPVPGDRFWTTDDDGGVLSLDPLTGIWQPVSGGTGEVYFGGMDVDPTTGIGYAVLSTGETPSELFTADVSTGALVSVGEVQFPAGETVLYDCRGIDLTGGVLTLACVVDAEGLVTLVGTIDFSGSSPAFIQVGVVPAVSEAIAVHDGIVYLVDVFSADVWTLPVGGGVPIVIGTPIARPDQLAPAIVAADFDSAGQLWAIDTTRDAGDLLEIDLATFAAAVTPFAGPGGENVNTQSLTITWPAPPESGLPGTGSSIVAESILLVVSLLAITIGAGVLVSRRPQE